MKEFTTEKLPDWQLAIIEKYPLIFKEPCDEVVPAYMRHKEWDAFDRANPPADYVNLRYGFECDKGWSELIEDLAQTATELVVALRKGEQPDAFVHGFICKEKFGTLRWQGHAHLKEPFKKLFRSYVGGIESRSSRMSEKSGETGFAHQTRTGWVQTLSLAEGEAAGMEPMAKDLKIARIPKR